MTTTAPTCSSSPATTSGCTSPAWAGTRDADVPIIVRGDGCYLEDANGKRYLDALAGLFSVNIGYGYGEEIGQAALEQMRELPFYTNWSYAHPRAIELAAEVASLAPGDLNRVFFVSGGSEAVESAWKLARQYYLARGEKRLRWLRPSPRRGTTRSRRAVRRAATRRSRATSPTTGRRSARSRSTASPRSGRRSSRSSPRCGTSTTRTATTGRPRRPRRSSPRSCSTSSSRRSSRWGPRRSASSTWSPCRTRAAPSRRRPATGRACASSATRYDILLSADEVITAFGRLGYWFGSERYDIRPDIVISRQGALVLVRRDRRGDRDRPRDGAVPRVDVDVLARDHVRRAPGDVRGRAEEHRDHEARRDRRARPREGGRLPGQARAAARLPIVGDVRGTGFFYAIELVKDQATRETFSDDECETLLRGFLSRRPLRAPA